MGINYTEQSRLFKDFRAIPYSDHYYLIRYYEQYHQDIDHLPFDEGMIMSFYYTNALFETGEYYTHIACANKLLEESIINDVRFIDGEDVYLTLLHQKTCAHLRLGEIDKATDLAKQLLNIAPNNYSHTDLLRQCYLVRRPDWIRPTLTISAIATLMGAITTIIFACLHFYTIPNALIMPYSLLLTAAAGLIATAIGYINHVERPLRKAVYAAREKKKEVV